MTNKQPPVRNPNDNSLPTEIEGFDSLTELALDLRWSWNHATDEVWRQLDPALWEFTQNPWVVLQTVAKDKLQRVLANPGLPQKHVMTCCKPSVRRRRRLAWFQQKHPAVALEVRRVFQHGIHVERSAAIYSGGLGMWLAIGWHKWLQPATWACRGRSGVGVALTTRLFSPGD